MAGLTMQRAVPHYLDDFLFISPSSLGFLFDLLHMFVSICKLFDVPLAFDKNFFNYLY